MNDILSDIDFVEKGTMLTVLVVVVVVAIVAVLYRRWW